MRFRTTVSVTAFLVSTLLVAAALPSLSASGTTSPSSKTLEFDGSRAETELFMRYNRTIKMTTEQEARWREALGEMRAPCCDSFSAATCCCECNLARSIWGLAKFMVVMQDASAAEVRATVERWLSVANPNGFDGNSCASGRCGRSFRDSGCGGMSEDRLVH